MSTAAAAAPSASSTAAAPESGACPICATPTADVFHRDTGKKSTKRPYLLCPTCFCVFVPPAHHLKSGEEEKSRYDNHQNNPDDAGYQTFLSQCTRPLAMLLSHRFLQICGASSESVPFLSLDAEDDRADDKNYFALTNGGSGSGNTRFALARHFAAKAEEGTGEILLSAEKSIVSAATHVAREMLTDKEGSDADDDSLAAVPPPLFLGLDWGCGPGPTLSRMMEQQFGSVFVKTPVLLYDLYYFPNEDVFFEDNQPSCAGNNDGGAAAAAASTPARRGRGGDDGVEGVEGNGRKRRLFDFITATEVAEHLSQAGAELTKLWSHVKPRGGLLAIQTSRPEACCGFKTAAPAGEQRPAHGIDITRFSNWHYTRDDTHITYHHLESFRYLRRKWGDVARLYVCGPSVVIFEKK